MFSTKVEEALAYASARHAGQTRKGGNVPYFVHPVHVAILVARTGGDDEEVTVALLHDIIEDTTRTELDRAQVQEEIRAIWGERVARAVLTLTEPKRNAEGNRLPWRARKEAYLRQLQSGESQALRVCAADKVHNLETLLDSLEAEGPLVWTRFRGSPLESRWFYREALRILEERLGPEEPLVQRLSSAAARLDVWVDSPPP